jgi:CBS domain-containing protein
LRLLFVIQKIKWRKMMTKLLVVILHEPAQLPGLLDAWDKIGLPGPTILDSAGGYRTKNWLQLVGLSLVSDLFSSREEIRSKTVLAVIDDEESLEKAVAAAETAIDGFDTPNKGLLFVITIDEAIGVLEPPPESEVKAIPSAIAPLTSVVEKGFITRNTPVSVVNEILKLKPVIVQTDHTLMEVAEAMVQQPAVTVACVVNQRRRLVGLIPLPNLTDDLFMTVVPEEFLSETRSLEDALHFADLSRTRTAADAMIPPVWVKKDDVVRDAFHKMHDCKISGVPVVDEGLQVTGYITQLDLLALYARGQKSQEEEGEGTNE